MYKHNNMMILNMFYCYNLDGKGLLTLNKWIETNGIHILIQTIFLMLTHLHLLNLTSWFLHRNPTQPFSLKKMYTT